MLWRSVLCCLLCSLVRASLVPTHVYLSLTGDPSQVQVTFTTTTKPTTAQVLYWLEDSPSKTAVPVTAAQVHTFTRPVTSVVNYINSVTLHSLQRGVYYNYQIYGGNSSDSGTTSKIFRFRTIPGDGKPVTIAIYGDLGAYGYAIMQTGNSGLPKYAQNGKFDIIVHNGDLAYNMGTSDGAVGDNFMENIQQVASVVPYMVTPGNHEFMDSGHDEQYYSNFWVGQTLLGKNSKSNHSQMWFSFDIGAVHVVGISTEVYCEDTPNVAVQYDWLESDLKAASSRADNPWIVVIGHRPLYNGIGSTLHSRLMRKGLQCKDAALTNCDPLTPCESEKNCAFSIEKLLVKYHVDMYNAGHEHVYVRNNPISQNLTYEKHEKLDTYMNPQHTLHIISGAAGTAHEAPDNDTPVSTAADTPAVMQTSTYSFSTLVAHNNTHVYYQQISAVDGATLDDFWIVKNKNAPNYKLIAFTLNKDTQTACDQ